MDDQTQSQSGKRYPLLKTEDADALVIHCSDPRFQSAFLRFVTEELGVKTPIRIIIPGGIHDLVSPARIKAARQLWEQIEFIIKRMPARRLILLNHDDCLWYGKWNALVQTTIGQDISGHLLTAAETLMKKKWGVESECYLAKIVDGEIEFRRVDKVG